MTVLDLRMKLAAFDDDCEVVMAKDGEGNGFSPLDAVAGSMYVAETTWSGHIKDKGDPMDEDAVAAVVLWPVN